MNQKSQEFCSRLILVVSLMLSSLLPAQAQVLISECMASNGRTILNSDYHLFTDWIEIINTGDDAVSLAGYWLSDNPDETQKWMFPNDTWLAPDSCLIVWADNQDKDLHSSFALTRDGESIILTTDEGVIVDQMNFGEQFPDVSYGRLASDPQKLVFFGIPTPGKPNGDDGVERPKFAAKVEFSITGGLYSGIQTVVLSDPLQIPGSEIHFTLDGSEPDLSSAIYQHPVLINESTPVRARIFTPGMLPGQIITHTYLLHTWSELPVFAISMSPDYLWNEDYGIYVDGSSFDGNRETRNSCQEDWERPMHIEFFETDGSLQFSEDAGIEVKGRMNCEFPKKPLGVFFKSKYGNNVIQYRMYQDKSITDIKSFYLRPGGADGIGDCYNGTMFRDELLSTILIGEMDIDYEAYRPAILYLNGEYWGIHNVRERNKADYLKANYGVNPDGVDILENPDNGGVIEGDDLHYQSLLTTVSDEDLNDPKVYARIHEMIDIDEFINYQIAEIYVNNEDWAQNNVLCWRPRTSEGRWRWVFFDVEGGFGLYGAEDYRNNTLNFKDDDFLRHRTLFWGLLRSDQFKAEFLQRFATFLNTTFQPDRVIEIIDRMKKTIESEMPNDINRWKNTVTNGGSGCRPISSMQMWEDHVELMKEFARNRPEYVRNHLRSRFNLSGTFHLDISAEGGSVMVNGATGGAGGDWFKDLPITLKAIPDPGFRFSGWTGLEGDSLVTQTFKEDASIRAVFTRTGENILANTVSELLVLTADNSPYIVRSDLVVTASGVLRLEAGSELRMAAGSSIYVYGAIQADGVEDNPVVIRSLDKDGKRWGGLVIENGQGYSSLFYLHLENAGKAFSDPVRYKANLNILETFVPVAGLHIADANGNPLYFQSCRVWLRDSELHSEGVCDLVNVASATNILIENCTFKGNHAPDTDAIDLDAVSNAIIRNNYFSQFQGFNSDGVDVGYSSGIVITGNRFDNIADKAISIGAGSKVEVNKNLITSCKDGVEVKDEGSEAQIDRNTFYATDVGIHCFEKEPGRGGGRARVTNSIFSSMSEAAVLKDEWSELIVNYSLHDGPELEGECNLKGDPGFFAASTGQFQLASTSICRDAGDPGADPDPDGSLPDLGYHYRDKDLLEAVFINEIRTDSLVPWFELFNAGTKSEDLSSLYVMTTGLKGEAIKLTEIDDLPNDFAAKTFLMIEDKNMKSELGHGEGSISLVQYLSGNFHPVQAVMYPEAEGGYSFGAYPDGSLLFRHLRIPTPGAPNYSEYLPLTKLYINEFLADNETGLVDETGVYEDWIELYNGSNEPVNVGGLFITDDLGDPTRFRIPDNDPDQTLIPAGGFKIFWADGEPEQGVTHLGFRLSSEGEEIGLFQMIFPDTLLIDSVVFSEQTGDISFGRLPDGGRFWQRFSLETPGFSNLSTSYDPIDNKWTYRVWPNPVQNELMVKYSDHPDQLIVEVFYPDGRLYEQKGIPPGRAGELTIDMHSMTPGLALVRILAQNSVSTFKIIVQH